MLRASEKMTRDPRMVSPDDSIREVARVMAEIDAGAVPVVGQGGRLLGMVTDRDIALRAVARGKGPDTPVREVMTPEVECCFEDDDLQRVARAMGEQQVRRLPVLSRDGRRLVGILSLGDIAIGEGPRPAGEALAGVSRPGGAHSQAGGPRTGPGA
jgi:CBS domain-containing protein